MTLTGSDAAFWFRTRAMLDGATIIEHRQGKNTVGRVDFTRDLANGQLIAIVWRKSEGGSRSVQISLDFWALEVVDERIVFLARVKRGGHSGENAPAKDCTLYTIFLGDRR